jgi:hypothetical protein
MLVMELEELDDGRVRIDLARAREAINHQQGPSIWSLKLRATGAQREFDAFWEDVPGRERESMIEISTDPLPQVGH